MRSLNSHLISPPLFCFKEVRPSISPELQKRRIASARDSQANRPEIHTRGRADPLCWVLPSGPYTYKDVRGVEHPQLLFREMASGQGRGFETFLNGRLTPSPMIQTPALGPRYSPGNHTNKGTALASRSTPFLLLFSVPVPSMKQGRQA